MKNSLPKWMWAMAFLVMANAVNAQQKNTKRPQIFKVPLTIKIADVEQQQLLQVLPLFMIKGDSVHQPIDISSDKPGMILTQYAIVPPQGIQNGIHAYGFSYHQHGKAPFPHHTLIYVDRPSNMQTQPTRVWADANHDLNFNNDSPILFVHQKPVVLPLDASPNPYSIELSLFGKKEFTSFQSMYKTAIDLIRGDRVYFGTQFSFREKRLNTAFGILKLQEDSIYIGVKDVNSNGSFLDEGVDRIVLSHSMDRFELENSKPLSTNLKLNWLGKSFELLSISEINELTISFDPAYRPSRKEIKNSKSLLVGQKLPRVKFCLAVKKSSKLTKTRKSLRAYRPRPRSRALEIQHDDSYVELSSSNKHAKSNWPMGKNLDSMNTLLVVWNAYDKQWEKDSADIHQLSRIAKNEESNLQVIMLNFGGSGKYVHRYNQRYELNNAVQGFCSATLARKLKIQTMPQYFLLDNRFNLLEINPNLKSLRK